MRPYHVYIMANTHNTVLNTGVTGDLESPIAKHREGIIRGFTQRYNVTKRAFAEAFARIEDAIVGEKQIRAGSRAKKVAWIEAHSPLWQGIGDGLRPDVPQGLLRCARNDRRPRH